jgi:uncharacterized protein (TIGR03083 family)
MPDAYVLREMVAAEQQEFADLLRQLKSEDWEVPSLCTGWSIRDAVIHITIHSHTRSLERIGQLARVGFSMDRFHAPHRDRKPDEIVSWLESPATLAGVRNVLTQLSELVIHQQDVRRPLGATRVIAPERLATVLDFSVTPYGSYALGTKARSRAKGLRLVASDIAWTSGTGPEVSGPGEALFMALNGRADALKDLTGAGVDCFAKRLS